jgi:hypothetical protein
MAGQHGDPANEPLLAQFAQTAVANPLLDALQKALAAGTNIDDIRNESIARYGFAVPSDEALDAIARCAPAGVVEVGAGTGYWACLLQRRGVQVAAFDIEPAPSPQNTWFAGSQLWHPVQHGNHDIVVEHPDRTVLIVWPTKNETWAATAVERYHASGGQCLVVIGEGPGGRTGDDTFHALLGELSSCVQCEYGATTSACICGVEPRWRRTETIGLPQWPGFHDDLRIYAPAAHVEAAKRRRRSWRRRPGQK